MELRIFQKNDDGIARTETRGKVQEVLINEDLLNSGKESISICFKGKQSSGIVDLTPEEFESLHIAVKDKLHLIKGFKTFEIPR